VDLHDLALSDPTVGIGHNVPPESLNPAAALSTRLGVTYCDLVSRFLDLELGCDRVPDPIANLEEAGLVTDFIAQCQAQLRRAESAHKEEKAYFLTGGRTVDAFFKRRCEKLSDAFTPVIARLKTCRDQLVAIEEARCEAARHAAEEELRRLGEEEATHRAEAERRAREAQTPEERRCAAEHLRLAEAAAERAGAVAQRASLIPEPLRIQGDYGATAYVTRSWSFEVIDLDEVPRSYLALDAERVRAAITKEGVREIPGLRIFEREELRVRGAV